MTEWYVFKPLDTLYFRGAEPMNIGENHTASSQFPPPCHTIAGALRTTVLNQSGISIKDYYDGNIDPSVTEAIGKAGTDSPFSVIGPVFRMSGTVLIPAPFSWYTDKDSLSQREIPVYRSHRLQECRFIRTDPSINLFWAKSDKGSLKSLGGMWVTLDVLYSEQKKLRHIRTESELKKVDELKSCILDGDALFCFEDRTGIALKRNRSVRPHHLYSFRHWRLREWVEMAFGVDSCLPIADSGVLKLGAEQRFGSYQKLSSTLINNVKQSGELFMTLSLVEGNEEANGAVAAAGKIQYVGGWDMKKGFHKPMKGYFPAGSVFQTKLNKNFIAI